MSHFVSQKVLILARKSTVEDVLAIRDVIGDGGGGETMVVNYGNDENDE